MADFVIRWIEKDRVGREKIFNSLTVFKKVLFFKARPLLGLTICLCPIISCSSGPDLEWRQEQGYRWAPRKPSGPGFWGKTGFQKLSSSQTNIHFTNRLIDEHIADNRNLLNGSGVAAGDIDGDGLTDLYFTQLDGPKQAI